MIYLERFIGLLASATLATFIGIILLDVVFRYWLHIPLAWPAEASVLCFQWVVFLGAPLALRRGLHFSVTIALDRLPPGLRRVADVAIGLMTLATSIAVAVLAYRMAAQSWTTTYPTLPVPRGAIYVGLCFSGTACAFFAVEQCLRGIRHRLADAL